MNSSLLSGIFNDYNGSEPGHAPAFLNNIGSQLGTRDTEMSALKRTLASCRNIQSGMV
jgi:hypothetical protein